MREDKNGIRCDMGFGKNIAEVAEFCRGKKSIPDVKFVHLNNPMPTGDHWKVLEWVLEFKKKGSSTLTRVPPMRRDFIKRAAESLDSGGFSIEIASMAARRFRDSNDLRMQRGKVFVFFSSSNLPLQNGDLNEDVVKQQEET